MSSDDRLLLQNLVQVSHETDVWVRGARTRSFGLPLREARIPRGQDSTLRNHRYKQAPRPDESVHLYCKHIRQDS